MRDMSCTERFTENNVLFMYTYETHSSEITIFTTLCRVFIFIFSTINIVYTFDEKTILTNSKELILN